MPQPTGGCIVAIYDPAARHPFIVFSGNSSQFSLSNPSSSLSVHRLQIELTALGVSCDSGLANQNVCIPPYHPDWSRMSM